MIVLNQSKNSAHQFCTHTIAILTRTLEWLGIASCVRVVVGSRRLETVLLEFQAQLARQAIERKAIE